MLSKYRFNSIDADYFQFHLQDAGAAKGGLADAWSPEALKREVAAAPLIVGVGTQRNTSVRLDLEVYERRPAAEAIENWRRIVECSIDLPSGRLLITSPTLALAESQEIPLPAGCYRLRICFNELNGAGKYRYKIRLWQEAFAPLAVMLPVS